MSAGMNRVRGFSVTVWVIIACVSVFMLDEFLVPHGGALQQTSSWTVVGYSTVADANGNFPDLKNASIRYEPPMDQPPAVVGRASPKGVPKLSAIRRGYVNGQQVEQIRYTNMPPLERIGYFSTARALIGLTPTGNLMGGEFWRFVSFQFLHGNFWHLLMNMFGLWIFGPLVERCLGGKRFLAFYLLCGIFGALMYLLLNAAGAAIGSADRLPFLLPNDFQTPLVGASAGVFGVLLAGAYLSPNTMVLLFFVIPVRLVTLAYGLVAVALFTLIFQNHSPGSNAGGEAAHLGGALAGFYFIRRQHHLHGFFDFLGRVDPTSKTSRARRLGRGGAKGKPASAARDAEIDRILEKIHEKGLQSLTAKEKRILRESSQR